MKRWLFSALVLACSGLRAEPNSYVGRPSDIADIVGCIEAVRAEARNGADAEWQQLRVARNNVDAELKASAQRINALQLSCAKWEFQSLAYHALNEAVDNLKGKTIGDITFETCRAVPAAARTKVWSLIFAKSLDSAQKAKLH